MDRFDRDDLRPEFLDPATRPILRAYLELIAGCGRQVGECSRRIGKRFTPTDMMVALYVFICEVTDDRGSSQSTVAEALGMSRRTIRDSMARMVEYGLLAKDEDACFFATERLAAFADVFFEQNLAKAAMLSDAVVNAKASSRRSTPPR